MRKLGATVIVCFLSLAAASQLPVLHWAKVFEPYSMTNSNGRTVGVDALGNVYSAGLFENTCDFDPGPGLYMMPAAGPFNYGIYISKLDANGNFVWAKQIPTYVSFGRINLKVDRAGNIYLASDLNNAADMDPGPGVYNMSPTGFRDAYVVKLNADGNLIWAKQFGGPGDTGPQASMVELDQDNNVLIAGIFNNTVDFDPGPATLNITSSAHQQGYIVKLNNSNGGLVWAKQFGNGPEVYSGSFINDMKCDRQGNIVLTGSFARTCDFDPGPGTYNVTSSPGGVCDAFICKLDANCNLIWVKTMGQNGTNNHFITPTGVAIDSMNNIFTTGFFIGDYDFDPGAGVQVVYSNPHDSYIQKLDQQGNLAWVKIIGNPAQMDAGYDIAVDTANNVYMMGPFGTSVDFDPGPGVHIINSPHYGASVIVKLTPGGNFMYAAPFQSIDYGTSNFYRMAIDPSLNIYVAGSVSGINDFDPGPAIFPVTGASNSAPFVLKLGRCLNATSSTLDISACDRYTLNNQTFDSTGTYLQTIPNSSGCDSLITLHLTINKKFTEQTKAICNGEFFFVGGSNQTTSGTYYDTLQTVLGCDSVITTHLAVNPKPSPDLGIDKNLCKNTQLTITPGSFTSYLWQDNSAAPNFTLNAAGAYWVTVTNNFNCAATDTFKVAQMMELPSNFLKKTDSICSFSSLDVAATQSYTNYLWSTGAVERNIQIQNPGIYRLTVTDANGCTGTDSITVFSKQCMLGVYIPTAFTPNGDSKNDMFKPQIFGNLKHYRLSVYNRWGTVVFQTTNPQKGWDGRVAGTFQDNAVFVWICTYELEGAQARTEKGSVLLIR
jgi:gliding motility-associated-like protein